MKTNKTLVLGATTNPDRYAFKAVHRLVANGYEVIPVGIRKGKVADIPILNSLEIQKEVHTITLYLGVDRQKEYYDYIIKTNPKRVIFNPGTENPTFYQRLSEKGIEAEEACTLVLLATNSF